MVVGMTVAALLSIRVVMLFIIGNQVVQRKAVMSGDKVHAGPRLAATTGEGIGGCGHAGCHLGLHAGIALPIGSGGIAEFVIPLGPSGRKTSDLVAAGADVPRF